MIIASILSPHPSGRPHLDRVCIYPGCPVRAGRPHASPSAVSQLTLMKKQFKLPHEIPHGNRNREPLLRAYSPGDTGSFRLQCKERCTRIGLLLCFRGAHIITRFGTFGCGGREHCRFLHSSALLWHLLLTLSLLARTLLALSTAAAMSPSGVTSATDHGALIIGCTRPSDVRV